MKSIEHLINPANVLRTFLSLILTLGALCAYAQNPFITTWKTDNPGTSNSTSITIPTTGGGYNYDVDWDNDGTYDQTGITGDVTHDYGTAGTYTMRIRGAFPRIYFNSGGDREKLLDISQWGNIAWTSMESAFSGCSNLNISATDVPNLSGVTSMASMFFGCSNLDGPANIGTWNTQTVTNMRSMFFGADSFNKLIGTWNTAAVTDMTTMFFGDESFNQNLGNWVLNASVVMSNMLTSTGMDCANYSATLIGWSNNPLTPSGRTLGASGRKYETAAVAARNNLTMTKGWTITDAGLVSNTFYADTDGDGYGNAAVSGSFNTCAPPTGYAANTTDCDDNCAACFPGNTEICDGKDNDCNGTIDDVAACGSAGTRTWRGLISTDWNTPCNWNPSCVPTADDNVIIPNVTNDPSISAAAFAKNVVVNAGGVLTIAATGSLAIEGAAMSNAISNKGTVHNHGTIVIGAVLTAGLNGIRNEGAFNNHPGGQLQVDRAVDAGIANFSAGTFTNSAIITVGGIAIPGNSGIANGGIFNNNSGAQIQINRSTSAGLFNGGTFNNDGSLTLGANFSVGTIGIFSNGTINNNPDGQIQIDRTVTSGIRNNTGGSFQNKGELNIGAIAAGAYGLHNNAAFSNHASGQILIERATSFSILNEGSSAVLDNYGTLTVAANNQGGIQNFMLATMHNRPCAQMFLYGRRLNNDATWTNSGFFRVDFAANAHLNTGTFTNNGIIEYPQGNPIPNVVNNEIMVAETVANTCDAISPVFGLGSPLDFTVVGIFTDAAATMSAGTYTTASNTFTPTSVLAEGSYTYYVKIEDNNGGCTRIATWKLITEDCCDAPEAICKSATIALVGNSASLSTADVNNGSTYECGLQSMTVSPSSFGCSHVGSPQTVTLTVTDVNNASSACQTTVTVVDQTVPTITCPANIAKTTDAGQCSAVTTYSVTASDNCTYTLTRTSPASTASGSSFPLGMTTVAWNVTDAGGNGTSCAFTVTVTDGQLPSIVCPANIVRNADAGLCTANVTYATPTYSDNCAGGDVSIVPPSLTSGSAFPKGTTMVSWKTTDAAGNTAICQFTVTVNDTQLPNISCPLSQTVGTTTGQCQASVNYTTPTGTDNCGLPAGQPVWISGGSVPTSSGSNSISVFSKGQTTVTWRVTDAVGLTKICTFRITVNDTEAPVITCPTVAPSVTMANSCASAPLTYSLPTATDNCPGAITLVRIGGPASGSSFPAGTTAVTWRAIDGTGRSSTCSFSVTVTDNHVPSITCPSNIAVTGGGSPCTATVAYATPTATDNCTVQSVFLRSGLVSGSVFPAGTTVNTWQATDNSGLSSTCSFTVTVGCGTSNEQTATRTGSSEALESDNSPLLAVSLAPNPATTEVRVTVDGLGHDGGEIWLHDVQGRMVWHQALRNDSKTHQISVDDLPSGLYFLTLTPADRTKPVTQKLIVERK